MATRTADFMYYKKHWFADYDTESNDVYIYQDDPENPGEDLNGAYFMVNRAKTRLQKKAVKELQID